MRKIKYFICLLIVFMIGIGSIEAASFSVKANKTTVVVGNSVNVTVSVSGSDAAGWEYCLNYDTSMFSLTSHSSSCILGGTLAGNKSVTFKLKSKKSGIATFGLRDASILNDAAESVLKSKGSVTVRAKTQAEIEASYSTNADLKSLSVDGYNISPSFSKDTLKYSLEVENEIDKVTIKATKADSSASVAGLGEKELTEGINKFNIVVTAEKGNKKTYVVEITRKELNPINVIVDGKDYTIVRKSDVLEAPTYYASTEISYDGEMVPALKSDITGYTLLGLKDEDGNIALYLYDDIDNSFKLYNQFSTEGVTIIPLETKETIENFEKTKNIKINDVDVNVYVGNYDSSFVLLYGMNAATGKSGWYKYDIDEGTFQRYEKIVTEEKKDNNNLYLIIAMLFGGLSFITIILVVVLIKMNSKLRKKNIKLIEMLENNKSKEQISKVSIEEEKEYVYIPDEKEESTVENLSKRELRRLEKEKSKAEKEELEKLQEEFFSTTKQEIVEENENSDIEEESLRKEKRKRK